MNVEVRQLKSVEEVLYFKHQLVAGLTEVSPMLGFRTGPEFWFKTLCRVVLLPQAYVGVAIDPQGILRGCGVAYEVTPPFYQQRLAAIMSLFFKPGNKEVLEKLQEVFEQWCKEREIELYFILSSRASGAATRCFQEYGLQKKVSLYMKGVK
jgi:hypothetical protein